MKPLLRAVLIVDALLLLGFGLLFVLTPWKALYDALQLVSVEPAMIGQAFGIALLGLAWLSLHAAVNGALTTGVARAVGHVNWLTGVVMLVWLIGLRTPALSGFGELVSVVSAAVLLVVGLGGVRLAAAVRRRDKAAATEVRPSGGAAEVAPRSVAPALVAPGRIEPSVAGSSTAAAASSADVGAGASGTTSATDTSSSTSAANRPPFHG